MLPWLLLLAFGPGTSSQAQTFEASIVFDQQPKANGLRFEARGMRPVEVERDGRKTWAWAASFGSDPHIGYVKSVFLTFTDPRFRNGQMPSVDIEVEFLHEGNSGVYLLADTKSGSRVVGETWGNSRDWKTLKVSLDDAHFGGRQFGSKPEDTRTDGYDLRINAYNTDFVIRGIHVRGYDRRQNPDFRRLLRLEAIDTPTGILLFSPGANRLTYRIANQALVPFAGDASVILSDQAGKALQHTTHKLNAAAGEAEDLVAPLNTKGLPFGVYQVRMEVRQRGELVISRESSLGLTPPGRIPKAKPGEFLYGMDVALGGFGERQHLLEWLDAVGVDIVRDGIEAEDPNAVPAQLARLEAKGLRVMAMSEVPHHADPAERRRRIAEIAGRLEVTARRFPQLVYWELGNEPDLPYFYPGPIPNYIESFRTLRAAIKRGNPKAIVMNGGLSFAGEEGERRSREFLRLIQPEDLDALAFHAHGPGAEAERRALERVRAVAREYGKVFPKFIDTESGVAARTPIQERVQARTAIQKFVFAQAEHMPMLFWFRLLMFEEDYGNLRTEQEPRPALIAFRNLVMNLRGHGFVRLLPTQRDGVEAYLFRQTTGNRHVAVLWNNRPVPVTLGLSLSGTGRKLLDLFGNSLPLVESGARVEFRVSEDPVFLVWEGTAEVTALPPTLEGPGLVTLLPTVGNPLNVRVRNTGRTVLRGQLSATIPDGKAVVLNPTVSIPPGGTVDVPVEVQIPNSSRIRFPKFWTVFANVDESRQRIDSFTEIPSSVQGKDGPIEAQIAPMVHHNLDIRPLGGAPRDWLAAWAFAEIESPIDQTVRVGAAADWWMAWTVNGERVYDTLKTGNGSGFAITDHTFDVRLRKGRNLVGVQVYSGMQGWRLLAGGPDDLLIARDPATSADAITLLLSGPDGKPMARETVPVTRADFLPRVTSLRDLAGRVPIAMLGEPALENHFLKEPDTTRWWKGESDLSATVWVGLDDAFVYLLVRVRDDVARTGDSVQFNLGLDGSPPQTWEVASVWTPSPYLGYQEFGMKVSRLRKGPHALRLWVVVNDDDAGYLKQRLLGPREGFRLASP